MIRYPLYDASSFDFPVLLYWQEIRRSCKELSWYKFPALNTPVSLNGKVVKLRGLTGIGVKGVRHY